MCNDLLPEILVAFLYWNREKAASVVFVVFVDFVVFVVIVDFDSEIRVLEIEYILSE